MTSAAQHAFHTAEIPNFSATGLRRCTTPGVGIRALHSATADFWRGPDAHVLVRCTGGGTQRSFRCTLQSGQSIPDEALSDMGARTSALLLA